MGLTIALMNAYDSPMRCWTLGIAFGLFACARDRADLVDPNPVRPDVAIDTAAAADTEGADTNPGDATGDVVVSDVVVADAPDSSTSFPTSFTLTSYVGPTAWTSLRRAAAVDAMGRLYVTNGGVVYVVESGTPKIYLTSVALKTAMAITSEPEIDALDVGPDGQLYLLHSGFKQQILVSTAAGTVATHRSLEGMPDVTFPRYMAVVDAKRIFLTAREGLIDVRDTGRTVLYPKATFGGSTDCANESLTATASAFIFYLPGCNGYNITGGPGDGSGFGILAKPDALMKPGNPNFSGVGRDPAGGAVVNFEASLWRFSTTGARGELATTPAMKDYLAAAGDSLFYSRPVVVTPTWTIYIVGRETIYRFAPK